MTFSPFIADCSAPGMSATPHLPKSVERPLSRLSKRITWKPRAARPLNSESGQMVSCAPRPMGDALGVALLALDADERGALVAELLQRDLADAQVAEFRSQGVELDLALLGADLDGDAALEIDAEVQPEHEHADQRREVDHARQHQRDLALAQEIEAGPFPDEMMRFPEHDQTGNSVGRRQRTQTASSMPKA